jgi:hypothetical protein
MSASDHLSPRQMSMFRGSSYDAPVQGPQRPAERNLFRETIDSGEHLKMFMSPNEIRGEGYELPEADDEADYHWKAEESRDSGMIDSIADEGVHHPVHLYHQTVRRYGAVPEGGRPVEPSGGSLPPGPLPRRGEHSYYETETKGLANGHHRFVSQELMNPDRLMPVLHYDGYEEALSGGFGQERETEATDRKPSFNQWDTSGYNTGSGSS